MKKPTLVLVMILINYSFARDIVWNFQKINKLSKQLETNPIFQKRRILKDKKIELSKLGRAQSPLYQVKNLFYRDFKTFSGQCFQVQIGKLVSYAYKANCISHKYKLTYNKINFDQVTDLSKIDASSFKLYSFIATGKLTASHFTKRMHEIDEPLPKPNTIVNISLEQLQEFSISKKSISLKTQIKAQRSRYAFLDKKSEIMEQHFKVELSKGDFLFQKGEQLILYKRFQPSPLNFKLLEAHHSYANYLANIDDFLFQFPKDKRCLRDDMINRTPFDCDYLIFKKQPFGKYYSFSAVLVNTKEKSIKRID